MTLKRSTPSPATPPIARRPRLGWHTAALATLSALALLGACSTTPRPATDWVCASAAAPCVRAIGLQTLANGLAYQDTTVGGLSAIDYDPVHDRWLLLSDDRSAHQAARFYTTRIRYTAQQLLPVELTGVVPLQAPDGQPYPSAAQPRPPQPVPDPEAARWAPDGLSLLWSSEGPWRGPQGPRDNGTLEGMALSPDGRTTWLAMEQPLRQDGPKATPQAPGGPVRITAFDTERGTPLRQMAYQPDAVPHPRRVPVGPQSNGVSEILADGPDHLLVLERAYSAGVGVSARLYRVALDSGSNTLALAALEPGHYQPARKTLVADIGQLGLPQAIDNLEGMAWGPPLADGTRVLVLVADDNFNLAQTTQFIALAWRDAPH
ncbi:MAG: esterase-like activity of phytase family protein [Comamonas sp.]